MLRTLHEFARQELAGTYLGKDCLGGFVLKA